MAALLNLSLYLRRWGRDLGHQWRVQKLLLRWMVKWLIMRNLFFSYQPPTNMSNMGDFSRTKGILALISYAYTFDIFFVCVFVSPFLAWSIFGSFHVSPMKKKQKAALGRHRCFWWASWKNPGRVMRKVNLEHRENLEENTALGRNSLHQKRHQVNHSKITSYSTRVSSLDNFVTVDSYDSYILMRPTIWASFSLDSDVSPSQVALKHLRVIGHSNQTNLAPDGGSMVRTGLRKGEVSAATDTRNIWRLHSFRS